LGSGFKIPTGPSMRHDDMKNAPDEKPTGKEPKPSRTEQAREVVEQYANDQREIIKNLRKTSMQ
jgi:hypothetical protein